MRLDEYVTYDGTALGQLLAKGDVTPKELGHCVTEAVASVNPTINAVIELYADAIDGLPAAARGGPFHGIPTLTKDFPIEAGRPADSAAGSRKDSAQAVMRFTGSACAMAG